MGGWKGRSLSGCKWSWHDFGDDQTETGREWIRCDDILTRLEERESAILAVTAWPAQWLPPLSGQPAWTYEGPDKPPPTVKFHRGFIQRVTLPTADFLRHAAAIFAAQPVTGVRLTDREPFFHSQADVYDWLRGPANVARNRMPAEFIDLMNDPPGVGFARYYSAEQAHAALSAACVSYGRSLVGLPPLEPNSEPKRTIAGVRETAGK